METKEAAGAPAEKGERGKIKVLCRFRPQNSREVAAGGDFCARFTEDGLAVGVQTSEDRALNTFTFDRVFGPTSTQLEVFETGCLPIVQAVLQGFNGTVFAYGQSSSGKTHTTMGDDGVMAKMAAEVTEGSGFVPRTIFSLWDVLGASGRVQEGWRFTITVSVVEIYLDRIRCLLDPTRDNLDVVNDPQLGVVVQGRMEQEARTAQEVFDLIAQANRNRATAATGLNDHSSRSHSVFMLRVEQENTATGAIRRSLLNVIDLAGSEMVSKTGATGKVLEEAKSINKTLSALGNCIAALTDTKKKKVRRERERGGEREIERGRESERARARARVDREKERLKQIETHRTLTHSRTYILRSVGEWYNWCTHLSFSLHKTHTRSPRPLPSFPAPFSFYQAAHIPFRDCKLTRILSESLGGNAKTCIVITCSPSTYNVVETLSTLRFGNRAKAIINSPTINADFSAVEKQVNGKETERRRKGER